MEGTMHLATAAPVTPTAPPPDPVLQQRIDALMDSTRQQIAEILSGGPPAGPRTASGPGAAATAARNSASGREGAFASTTTPGTAFAARCSAPSPGPPSCR
jgi:hypothetical protein